jgi:RNA polymerase sigma-70 factor (ECF subfamily)
MLDTGISPDEAVQPEQPAAPEEDALVRRAQMGSAAAFEQLVVARGPELYRYLAMRLRNESDARDALQETFLAAWQSLPSLRQPARFWPWLVAIAAHKAADVVRARRPVPDRAGVVDREEEDALEVREALDRLPPRFREVLLLRYGLQLSEHEVADVLGIRVGTVKSRSARARKALEELMR